MSPSDQDAALILIRERPRPIVLWGTLLLGLAFAVGLVYNLARADWANALADLGLAGALLFAHQQIRAGADGRSALLDWLAANAEALRGRGGPPIGGSW